MNHNDAENEPSKSYFKVSYLTKFKIHLTFQLINLLITEGYFCSRPGRRSKHSFFLFIKIQII